MKVTSKQVMYLCNGTFCDENPKYTDYKVIGTEKVTKTIRHKIPYSSHKRYNTNEISGYLKGFEKYYNEYRHFFEIKDEYKENRPEYEIEVTYELLDIELTEKGKEECKRRYNLHKRNMEKYARLLG